MTNYTFPNLALGAFIDETRRTIPVNGKILSTGEVSKLTGMSEHTYMSVKKGIASASGTIAGFSTSTTMR